MQHPSPKNQTDFILLQVERTASSAMPKKASDLDDFESVMKRIMEDHEKAMHGSDDEDEEWSEDEMFEDNDFD